jgi:hypothetical protein
MFKNTLKTVAAVAALTSIGMTANAQSRIGGPLVIGNRVGFFRNSVNTVGGFGFNALMLNPAMRIGVTSQFPFNPNMPSSAPNNDPNFVPGVGPKWVATGILPPRRVPDISAQFPINPALPSYAPNGDPNFVLGPGPKWVSSTSTAATIRRR